MIIIFKNILNRIILRLEFFPGKLADCKCLCNAAGSLAGYAGFNGAIRAAFPPHADWNSLTSVKLAANPLLWT